MGEKGEEGEKRQERGEKGVGAGAAENRKTVNDTDKRFAHLPLS